MPHSTRWIHALALAAIAAFVLWHAAKHAVPIGIHGPQSDGLTQGLPKVAFYAQELRAGRLPTWDPYAGTGSPDYPVRHHVMYPPTLATVALLPPWLAMLADYLVAFLLIYWFGYLFFRRATTSAAIAAAATLGLVFRVNTLFYPYFAQTAAWIPLVLLAVERLFVRDGRAARHLALGAFAVGMMVLAGMLNYAIYTLLAAAAFILFETGARTVEPADRRRAWWQAWLLAAVMVGLGLALGAARLSPLLYSAGRMRSGYETWTAFSALLAGPDALLASLAPGAFSDYGVRRMGSVLACGLVVWSLGLAFVVTGRKTRRDWFWMAVFVAGLLGYARTPLAHLLFRFVPGYSSFEPSRIWIVSGLALLYLAARALTQIAAGARPRRLLLPAATIAGLWALAFAVAAPPLRADAAFVARQCAPFVFGLAGLLAATLLVGKLGAQRTVLLLAAVLSLEVFGRVVVSSERVDIRRHFRSTPIIEKLRAAPPPFRVLRIGDRWNWFRDGRLYTQEALKYDGIEDLHAYSSMIDPALRDLLDAFREGRDTRLNPFDTSASIQPFLDDAPLRNGLANWVNARFILSQQPLAASATLPLVAEHAGLYLYENRTAFPRFWVAGEATYARNTEQALAAVRAGLDWAREVVLVGGKGPARLADAAPSQAQAVSNTPTEQRYRVAGGGGFLVVTELYDRDWHAAIDGRPAKLYRANVAFRAVAVPAGEHEVVFTYVPRAFHGGLVLSAIALVVVALLALLSWRKPPVTSSLGNWPCALP